MDLAVIVLDSLVILIFILGVLNNFRDILVPTPISFSINVKKIFASRYHSIILTDSINCFGN
jgi:hypothetical protein